MAKPPLCSIIHFQNESVLFFAFDVMKGHMKYQKVIENCYNEGTKMKGVV